MGAGCRTCCDSCMQGGPCASTPVRMQAPSGGLTEPCPHCGAPDFGSDECPRCGYDWLGHWQIWETGYYPDQMPLAAFPSDSFKGGTVPGVDQFTPYVKRVYPPASLIGPCQKRYPRNAYGPRLPHQKRAIALMMRGIRPIRQMAPGMSKKQFGLMRKHGLIK